jgi:signal transduction histidine kinase
LLEIPKSVIGYWSASGLIRILENLLTNAIKHGDNSEPVTIRVEADVDVKIMVHNRGPEIPRDSREQLFQPFHQAQNNRSGNQKGWGLGLTLVKGITDAHGGTVTFESDKEHGTTFKVVLPWDSRQLPA